MKLRDELFISKFWLNYLVAHQIGINMLITASGFNAGELTIDDALDFTEQQLKDMWTEAKEI